jgi:hypothetical protein
MAITTFIPELWSARLLYNLENSHVATQLVNRDYEGIIRNQGDTVHINSIGEITVSDYTKNTDLADPEVLATTDQTLVIDQAKAFNFQVSDIDKAQAAGDIVNTAMQRAAYKLADAADAYLLKTIANGASSANAVGGTAGVTLTAENVYENMVKLRTALDKANVPTAGRSVVVPPDVYALLLLDDRFVKASDAGTSNSVLLNGEVGKVAGMSVFMSNNVTKKSSQWIVTAQVPYATTYAEQIISTEAYRMEKRFADGIKGLHVYGAKVTDSTAIASMLCTVG